MKKNATPRTEWYMGFAPLIIILVIAILSVVGYFGYKNYSSKSQTSISPSPSPEDTSEQIKNWKTYTNTKYSFSFKYPNTFVSKNENTALPLPQILFVGDSQHTLILRVSSDSRAYSLQNIKETTQLSKKIEAYTAYLSSGVDSGGGFFATTIIPFEGYFIDMIITPNDGDESRAKETEKLRDQILLTLKFTVVPTPQIIVQDPALISFVHSKLSLSNKAKIEVTIYEGNYAYGNAGEPDGPGFYWAAGKINDVWSDIVSGNGIPNCKDVDFIPAGTFNGKFDQCYSDKFQLIDRTKNK